MNYYERHLGDYAKDAGHLSLVEHGAYTLLLDRYYSTEAAIPKADIYRVCRAVTKAEKDAVQTVLREFFHLHGEVYRHNRCEEEIARAAEKRGKARESANARWKDKRPTSEGNANAYADAYPNASANAPTDALRTQSEGNALQSPVSNHQTGDSSPAIPGKARKPRAKTLIPDDFALDPELEQYALDRLPGVDVRALFEGYRGKAIAKAWEYANWRQAFQEFVRNCSPTSGHWAAGQYPRRSTAGARLDMAGNPIPQGEWQ